MRDRIWNILCKNIPAGELLPWWALAVRAVLFPLQFFYWRMNEHNGYQWRSDTWIIDGIQYSALSLRWLAKAQGETYRITRTGDTVTLQRVFL